MVTARADEITAAVAGHTVATRFRDTVQRHGGRVALRSKDGDSWAECTWSEYGEQACRVAGALQDLGVVHGDRVVLMMRNRPEFNVADIATVLVGGTPVSIYNSSAPDQISYLAHHCGTVVAIVEDVELLERLLKVRDELPSLRHLAVIDDDSSISDDILRWSELVAHEPLDLDEAAARVAPTDLATVIYTSGTTGPPKGVMLDHANIVWTVESLLRCLAPIDPTGYRLVSYLPMAHIAERMNSHYQGIIAAFNVATCPEPRLVGKYLPDVRPEIFFAVPRIWEKLHAGVLALAGADPDQQAALDAALPVGEQMAEHRARDTTPPADLARAYEAHRPTLEFVTTMLGLDQVVVGTSGAAPLPVEVLRFFRAIGVDLSEIYGLSETSGPSTWTPFRVKLGTVGPPMPGTEVMLADDGEVFLRGGNIFRGYLNDPERTREVLDDEGWLHTGDVGRVDDDGYLAIVDRKKELIITAGGKNVSPANIEASLKAFPLIGQACVIGDARPFISALLVLDGEVAPSWAERAGVTGKSLAELAKEPVVLDEIEGNVASVNAKLNSAEQIRRYTLLSDEWLPDSEELTPTMKLKRRGIHAEYADEIEAMYRR
jgi:long-chain acyl-CoA synthetase